MDYSFIKDTVFRTVDFEYHEEIEFFEYDGVHISYDGKRARIGGCSKVTFARGCFLFAMNIAEGRQEFEIKEKPCFKECGLMLDCSRNGVMKVSSVKRYVNILASLGLNFLMLYTEDTYEIENRPRFGYLRGRYTKDELKEIVEYGEKMGVEIFPCIQTLGHMEQYLKWGKSGGPDYSGDKLNQIRDTSSVLLCDEEETYRLIEDEIRTCSEVYKSRKIHIGMDEAHDLGLGRYLSKHGYQNRYDTMVRHLKIVVKICEKYGLEPIMWSDMFFRLGGTGGYYRYQFDFPKGLKESMPDVQLVYWDYYHCMSKTYDNMFKKHYELSDNIAFAGSIVTCHGFLVSHDYSYINSVAAAESCIKNGIKSVTVTTWGDDGNETNAFLALSLLPVYSEYCYRGMECTKEDIERVSEFLTKINFQDARAMGNLSFLKNNPLLDYNREVYGNDLLMGKRLFYSDVLYDMSVNKDTCDEIMEIYEACAQRMQELEAKGDKNQEDYHYAYLLYKICSLKAELVKNFRRAYKEQDRTYLEKVLAEFLPQLKAWYEEFARCHKKQWYRDYKPFGFEVLSFRYGGVIARISDAMEILDKYLNQEVAQIDELEEEILYKEQTYPATVADLISPSGMIS